MLDRDVGPLHLSGFHHLTAITANAERNHAFYVGTLGMRLVKKTVNQDDVSAYHLFYADGVASPGSDVTFFEWPVGREGRGTNSVVRTHLRVGPRASLDWWVERLAAAGVVHSTVGVRDGRAVVDLEDPEGQRLALVEDPSAPANAWRGSPVPAEHQIRGIGPIRVSVATLDHTQAVLTQVLAMRQARAYAVDDVKTHVFEMGAGGPQGELHVMVDPHVGPATQGAGGVHHVAFRVPDVEAHDRWIARLQAAHIRHSGAIDRYYFRSLYFREPSGILFEIATDGPGFAVDEPLESLGERLALPPFLESRRKTIEESLKPLR